MRIDILCIVFITYYYLDSLQERVACMNESVGASISNRWGMGGGFMTLMYGWLTDANTAIFIGVMVTIGGFLMSLYFQQRRAAKERREAEFRMQLLLKEEDRKQELHLAKLQRMLNTNETSTSDQ